MFNCLDIKYQTIVQLIQSPKSPTILVWPGMADTVPEARTGDTRTTNAAPYTIKIFFILSKISHLGPWQIALSLPSMPKSPVGQAIDTRTTNAAPYTHKDSFYIVKDIPPWPLANCIESVKHAESPRRTGDRCTYY